MKAMIFAAGLGTRFKPWTDKHPKALAIVTGKSLLQRNIEYLQQFGITDIIVNVHHFADQVLETIKNNKGWKSNITISDEKNEVLETGGGLKKVSWYFDDGSFVVMNVDILTDLDLQAMINFHQQNKPLATLAITSRKTSRYFLFDEDDNLCGWRNVKTNEQKISIEKHDLVQKAFSGIHIIEPKIFPLITQTGKFSIVDTYLDLVKSEIIKGFDHSNSKLIDVGKPESLIEAEKLFS
ncbi:MAG TPA: sugar phosphate nucleotidyltransferase [Puia sp.]|jgi:MurNAc alpha-1-phosphate uridylyltransferase|nr:sugar phosphate nucleotidyltransferase [Puia sp.]